MHPNAKVQHKPVGLRQEIETIPPSRVVAIRPGIRAKAAAKGERSDGNVYRRLKPL
jgi:hypothetical protein